MLKMALLLLFAIAMTGCSKPASPTSDSNAKRASAKQATNAAAAKISAEPPTNELAPHRSYFDPFSGGKDPFFPLTTRVPRSATNTVSSEPEPLLPLSSYVKLTGLWPSKTRPMALINKSIFEPGDRGPVTLAITNRAGGEKSLTVQVHCLEIRKDSVKITIDGEPGETELRMRESP